MTDRGRPVGRSKMLYGLPGGNQVDGLPPATSFEGKNHLLSHSGICPDHSPGFKISIRKAVGSVGLGTTCLDGPRLLSSGATGRADGSQR